MIKKFNDNLNTAVFTTKFVLTKESPILYVFHYEEDGAWQFSGNEEELNDSDYKLVSLEEIIELDASVIEIADLPLEHMASRESQNHSWIIEPII